MARSAKTRMTEDLVEAARREARTMSIEALDRKIEAAGVRCCVFGTVIDQNIWSALKAVRAGREA